MSTTANVGAWHKGGLGKRRVRRPQEYLRKRKQSLEDARAADRVMALVYAEEALLDEDEAENAILYNAEKDNPGSDPNPNPRPHVNSDVKRQLEQVILNSISGGTSHADIGATLNQLLDQYGQAEGPGLSSPPMGSYRR